MYFDAENAELGTRSAYELGKIAAKIAMVEGKNYRGLKGFAELNEHARVLRHICYYSNNDKVVTIRLAELEGFVKRFLNYYS